MIREQTPPLSCTPPNLIVQNAVENFYQTLPTGEVASGLSVVVIDGVDGSGNPNVTRCYSGYADVEKQELIDESTVFEIGSMTKTFTATMLADAVNKGKVNLDYGVQYYYDDVGKTSVTLPLYTDPSTGDKYAMTMLDLADYTSGIPDKSPTNTEGPNEYKYSLMHDYLKDLGSLPVWPGKQFKYVNTNFGMLGELMMLMKKFDKYEDALKNLIKDAGLKMGHTGVIEDNKPSIHHLAKGYRFNGQLEKNYALPTWPALQGAGAIYSTLDDMLEWLQFNMGLTNSPYTVLLPMLQKVWFPTGTARGNGLGWFISILEGTTLFLISKNGGTYGFHSWMGFLPDSKIGAVLLCNTNLVGRYSGGVSPVDSLGESILQQLAEN